MCLKSLYLFLFKQTCFTPFPIHTFMLTMEKPSCSTTGSQSGWTLYFDQSKTQSLHPTTTTTTSSILQDEETEEDLSMLSDASSGPPHTHEDEENYSSSCSDEGDGFLPVTRVVTEHENCKRRKVEEGHWEEHSGDSTLSFVYKANSSNNSNKCLLMEEENSCFSATHF